MFIISIIRFVYWRPLYGAYLWKTGDRFKNLWMRWKGLEKWCFVSRIIGRRFLWTKSMAWLDWTRSGKRLSRKNYLVYTNVGLYDSRAALNSTFTSSRDKGGQHSVIVVSFFNQSIDWLSILYLSLFALEGVRSSGIHALTIPYSSDV